jgi:Endopolygalacturonase
MAGEYLITDFGAAEGGHMLCSAAIQNTIDEAAANGGGLVIIPEGTFLSGAIFLKDKVSLRIDGTLLGSDDISRYPMGPTRFEGHEEIWPAALINGIGLNGVHIYGKGTVDGNGIPFYQEFWAAREEAIKKGLPFVNKDVPRPRLLFLSGCRQVCIEEISCVNSGFWNLHIYDCSDVLVSHVSVSSPHSGEVRAASTDGIDIDASERVVVTDCYFAVDDDCICIKGGKGPEAHRMNRVTRDILIEHCRIGFGHGAVTFGSEANIVENVLVRDLEIAGENQLVRFKFRPDTVQCFSDIVFENIHMDSGVVFAIRPWISRQDEILGENLSSEIRNLTVRSIQAENVLSPGCILASPPSSVISGLHLENVAITTAAVPKELSRHDSYEKEAGADSKTLLSTGVSDCILTNVTVDGVPILQL